MRTHVDWLTFTMTPRYGTYDATNMSVGEDYAAAIEQAWIATFDPELLADAFGGAWEKQEKSRAPYSDAWTLPDAGITLFAGIALNHCCVEISGSGCERLIEKNLLEEVIGAVVDRVTRIDIACDIQTDIKPHEFTALKTHNRMRSGGHQFSATGETEYVGSRTSDRFARVYRYNAPHPRAHLLRVEHVFRKEYAKKVAREIVLSPLESIASAAGLAFGWSHSVWDTGSVESVDISIASVERNQKNTVFWLITSVAPAFKRLCNDGAIRQPEEFLRQFFLSQPGTHA